MSIGRRLSQLLLASHVGLVLLFAALLLATGVGSIRSAVEGQARTEAERSLSEARRRLQEWQRELDVAADLLAEQPTLRFYLQRGQLTKARTLLRSFHATSDVEYLRVQLRGRTIAEIGPPPPALTVGLNFDSRGRPWRVVQRQLPMSAPATLVLAESIGERLNVRPSTEFISATLRPLATRQSIADPLYRLLLQISGSGEADTYENIGGAAALRVERISDDQGEPDALLLARVEKEWVEQRIVEWLAAFGATGLLTIGLALGLAWLLSARISRPFAQLAGDAERLGRGDLDTPVATPDTFLAEPIALSGSLEQMRQQVSRLTHTERSQREELDAVLDGVDEGIVGVDAQQRIHYANRQFLALVGKSREDVLGLPPGEVLLPAGNSGGDADAATATGLPALERYSPLGKQRPLTVRRRNASGDRQVWVVRDENAIEAARAMRDRILANLSHEFQTPLSAQIASIELLRDHLRDGSDAVALRLADAQYRGTMRLSQLVDNLLESVRIESGEMRLRRQPVDLAAVVNEAVELMQPLVDQREQRIVRQVVAGPSLTGDSPRLFSVMVNLLANANKFAPDRSTIWLDMQWLPEEVTVWVEDEGPGLPTLQTPQDLFAPFRRAPHEEPSQRGTGLGLAIVYAVVLAHGGEVKVAAPLHGRGARLGILLPLEAGA
jgi:signal transduction histidine kinase